MAQVPKEINEGVTQYGLRHTFVSIMKNDIPEPMLKMLVGHSENMDTTGVYGHIIKGEGALAASLTDQVFSRNVNETST